MIPASSIASELAQDQELLRAISGVLAAVGSVLTALLSLIGVLIVRAVNRLRGETADPPREEKGKRKKVKATDSIQRARGDPEGEAARQTESLKRIEQSLQITNEALARAVKWQESADQRMNHLQQALNTVNASIIEIHNRSSDSHARLYSRIEAVEQEQKELREHYE